jgi:hypothetical protein
LRNIDISELSLREDEDIDKEGIVAPIGHLIDQKERQVSQCRMEVEDSFLCA